ncbi:MAG: hypothetical protein ACYTBJ_16255 [Planctomycetota bacterium]|jgi:hypothetical protein
MSIVIRYLYDEGQGEEWAEIRNMSADDAALLTAALPRPPISAPWSNSGVWGIRPVDGAHEPLEQNEEFDGVWEQRIVFDVLYNALETPRDFECFGIYADFATLSATDGSKTWLGSSRNELRRLADGTVYEWTGSSWEELNVPTFKTVARASSTLPQSTSTAYFTVTGTCWVMPIVSRVETVIQAQANNAKWIANPTVGASVDMCATADITGAAAESTFSITGTLTDALVITAGGAGTGQAAPVRVRAGTIEFSCDASSTGATSVDLHYMPIDAGATITAA